MKYETYENDLIIGMQDELRKQASKEEPADLKRASETLHAALEIFEKVGMTKQADAILKLMQKIAEGADENDAKKKKQPKKQKSDWHTKNLSPEQQIANYKDHGTPFNMADDVSMDDDELFVSDEEAFED
jgi:hypothetical protein